MRFLTLSSALLLLGLVSADEPSLECAMYAEACESICVLNKGGELAVSKCAKEATSCMCDAADMSEYINQNAIVYINNLSENDLNQFIDSSYERYATMIKEAGAENTDAVSPVINDISKLEKDALKSVGDEEEGDEEEGDEEEGDEEEGDEEEEEEAAEDDSDENDEKQDKNDADELEDEEEEEEEEEDSKSKNKDAKGKSASKALARAQDPFCQVFLSRCKDDCSASQSEASCEVENSDSGYLLACACNGVDISSSVYAQVKAENQIVGA